MKVFVTLITYFVLLYPLLMAIFWTVAAICHYLKKDKVDEFTEQIPLTILVPIYNEEIDIKKNLLHNLSLDYQNYKVIAIDDQSTDQSVSEIKKIVDSKLIFFQNEINMGKAKTLNQLINKVDTDYFIVIDSDTKLASNALQKINNQIQQDAIDGNQAEVAAYTGNITVHAQEKNKVFRMQKIEYRAFIDMIKRSQYIVFKSIMTLSGACSVYNTKLFHEIGGFSEENATEDINISWRYNMSGYRLVYIDDLYASVTTPSNVFDLILQRKRWTNGLLQTMVKYKSDIFKMRNLDLKIYTLEIVISSLWALSLIFVNLYYITMLFTNYYEDLKIVSFIFPTLVIFVFSTILTMTSYAITDNDRESKSELVKYYLLFPFAYFYIQPVGFILGFIETIKKTTNEKWRRQIDEHSRYVFATIIDIIVNVILLQLVIEIFSDFGLIFDQYWQFLVFLIFYIGIILVYYKKLYFGEQFIARRIKVLRNPSFYIVLLFIILRFIKASLIFQGVLEYGNIYKINIIYFFIIVIASMVLFEVVYHIDEVIKKVPSSRKGD